MDRDSALRPIDLARAAGISTQQVRNYEEAGVLPPVPRTATGHRRFDHRHRQAMLTYRALAAGHGGDAAQQIMRAIHAGDVPAALARIDAGHAALHEERRALRATGTALEAVARQAPDEAAPARSGMRVGEVADALGVRSSALRVWESAGLLAPARDPVTGYRSFSATDVRDARMISMLRRSGYLLPQIRPVLEGLRLRGSSDALRGAIAQRQAALTARAMAMLEGAGRLHRYLDGTHEPEQGSATMGAPPPPGQ